MLTIVNRRRSHLDGDRRSGNLVYREYRTRCWKIMTFPAHTYPASLGGRRKFLPAFKTDAVLRRISRGDAAAVLWATRLIMHGKSEEAAAVVAKVKA